MSRIVPISIDRWDAPCPADIQARSVEALEAGDVLFLPHLAFEVRDAERPVLTPDVIGNRKNVSWDSQRRLLGGTLVDGPAAEPLRAMLERFAQASEALVRTLLPSYASHLALARTSFRPAEIAGRKTSWRKDDSRLHVDSFPSSPVGDQRILRVFSNIDPDGAVRAWRIGEPFEQFAREFMPRIAGPVPGSAPLLRMLRITKRRRTPYDHFMLKLHDRMKADPSYQTDAPQTAFAFPPGSTWIVFTDQVLHAAMAGKNMLEQTLMLPVEGMVDPARSPLRVLERIAGHALT